MTGQLMTGQLMTGQLMTGQLMTGQLAPTAAEPLLGVLAQRPERTSS